MEVEGGAGKGKGGKARQGKGKGKGKARQRTRSCLFPGRRASAANIHHYFSIPIF